MKAISSQTNALRLASFITAANVLVASGFSIAGLSVGIPSAGQLAAEEPRLYSPCMRRRVPSATLIIFIAIYNRLNRHWSFWGVSWALFSF